MTVTSQRTHKRPWLAALLAFLQPGLGHIYLRAWARALLWFVLWVATVAIVAPLPAEPTGEGLVGLFLATMRALDGLSFEARLALFSVAVFSTLDAYWMATRNNHRASHDEPHCPTCGKPANPELGFCHWCTTEFDGEFDAWAAPAPTGVDEGGREDPEGR